MNYRFINKDGLDVVLPTRVKTASDHKEIYAHGAMGAALANYHFRLDFYRDIFPPLEFTAIGNEISGDSVDIGVERRIMASIYLPLPFLKELRNWLDKKVEEVEIECGEIQLIKKEDDAESLTEPKIKKA
jgi:hypothetical protein